MIAALKRWYLEYLRSVHIEEAQHANALAADQARKAKMHYDRAEHIKRDLMMHDLNHYEQTLRGN